LITAIHGLHMLGGLLVLGRTAKRVWHEVDPGNVITMSRIRTSVELCTTYWHWLLLIWLGVFTLLLTT
jgi:cytochrome c oxidase subunit 3